jgi:hypothetical protein
MFDNTADETNETITEIQDADAGSTEKPVKAKSKPAKPKAISAQAGPIYLLLQENGKYKELRESELQTEAAGIFRDPSLRLVKAQFMIPELSFKLADE